MEWVDFPDWLWWKAQLYQESRFDPSARSQSGAEGIAQFMPKTWIDITRQLGWSGISANQADQAIQAGAYYMHQLRVQWKAEVLLERHNFGMASYNAGSGNIARAQRLCGGTVWSTVSKCLSQVTGNQANQTLTYVSRIQQYREQLQ